MTTRTGLSTMCARLLLIGASVVTLAVPAAVSAAEFRLGHVYPIESPAGQAAQKFADVLKERSKGEISIKVFPSGQLGGDEQMGRDLSRGLLDFSFLHHGSVTGLDKRLDICALPFAVTTFEQADQVFYGNGVVPTMTFEALNRLNIHFLAWFESEFRAVSNSKRPITTVADIRGLKLRVPASRTLRTFFDDTGAQTVVMPFTELFTALQQKTVDGQDNGPMLTLSSKLYESTKYMTLTNHMLTTGTIVSSQAMFSKLTPEQRELVTRTAQEISKEQIQVQRTSYNQSVAKLRASGVEVIELSPAARKELRQIAMAVWDKMADVYGADKIAQLRKETESFK